MNTGMRWLFPCALLCLGAAAQAAAVPPDAAALRDYNVIIVDFDTLRADRLGALGNPRPLTPNLDAVAAKSYLFSGAVAQAPWTLPSTMSFFTSLYPHRHSLVNKFSLFTEERKELAHLPRRFTTLAQVFARNGYATAGFTGDAGLEAHFGFGNGFDTYFDSVTFGGLDLTLPLAWDWLQTHQDRKFFLFVQGYDVHGQFPVPPDFKSRFADPGYDGPFLGLYSEFMDLRMKTIKGEEIRISTADARFWMDRYDEKTVRADARFGRFWKDFSALPAARKTLLVVIGDHGEEFDEHGGFDHGMKLYDELLRVPLILHAPDGAAAKINSQVRLIDVMPTLADWLGLAVDTDTQRQMQGTSLLPLLRGQPLPLDSYAETSFLLQAEKSSLRTSAGWKLIYDFENMAGELYDLRSDPGEKRNVYNSDPKTAKDLTQKLLSWK